MERDTNYYADLIAARYPELDVKQVRAICQRAMRRIHAAATRNQDVRIYSGSRKLSLKIYTHAPNAQQHNDRKDQAARTRRFARFQAKRTKRP